MFEMTVNSSKKAFIIKVGGFFQEQEAKDFMDTYTKHINSFRSSEYNLVLVADELSTSKQEMIPVLEGIIGMYKSTGFKAYYSTEPKSVITKMQLKKVAANCNMDINFAPTVEDVLNKL